jgi:hypothetical protein
MRLKFKKDQVVELHAEPEAFPGSEVVAYWRDLYGHTCDTLLQRNKIVAEQSELIARLKGTLTPTGRMAYEERIKALEASVRHWSDSFHASVVKLRDANDRITAQAERIRLLDASNLRLSDDYNKALDMISEARSALNV